MSDCDHVWAIFGIGAEARPGRCLKCGAEWEHPEIAALRTALAAATERAEDATARLANLESVVLDAVQKASAAQSDLTAARALLREVTGCVSDKLLARIEAHLEGR